MKPQPETSTQEVLAGLVERVTYHNAENGFCVLRAKARGHRDIVEENDRRAAEQGCGRCGRRMTKYVTPWSKPAGDSGNLLEDALEWPGVSVGSIAAPQTR